MADATAKIVKALSSSGLLLEQDKRILNVVTMLTDESLSTSWWSHPKARLIFAVLSQLSDHPDVLFTKLLYRKVTLVHRALWPAFLAVGASRAAWQMRGLSPPARALLDTVNKSKAEVRCSGKVVKELEFKLLAHAEEIHTQSGRHESALEGWSAWRRRVGVAPLRSATLGRQQLEEAASAIGVPASAFPWFERQATQSTR